MRPVQIEMEGFGAFKDRTVVDFADAELFALIGPTGAGKSTIIDAITFALYGSIARYDNQNVIAPSVNALSNEGKVRLDFEHDGESYCAVRVMRRQGTGVATREARLFRGDVVLAGRPSEMAPAVEALLGLNFDQFTRTVVLPQGEFAQFLRDSPAQKQELLRKLLGFEVYERVRKLAVTRQSEARAQAELLEGRIDELTQNIPFPVEQLELQRSALSATLETIRHLDDRARTVELDQQRAVDIASRAADIVGLLASITPPAGLDEAADRLEHCQGDLHLATERFEAAQTDYSRAQEQRLSGPDDGECSELLRRYDRAAQTHTLLAELGSELTDAAHRHSSADGAKQRDQTHRTRLVEEVNAAQKAFAAHRKEAPSPSLTECQTRRDRLHELEELAKERASAREAECDAQLAHDTAVTALSTAESAHKTDDEQLSDATDRAGVLAFRHLLNTGDPCPLCNQPIAATPEPSIDDIGAAEVTRLRQIFDESAQQLSKTRDDERATQQRLTAATERSELLNGQLRTLMERLDRDRGELAPLAGRDLADSARRDATPDLGDRVAAHRSAIEQLLDLAEAHERRSVELSDRLETARQALDAHDRDPEVLKRRSAADDAADKLRLTQARHQDAELANANALSALSGARARSVAEDDLAMAQSLQAAEIAAAAALTEARRQTQTARGSVEQARQTLAEFTRELDDVYRRVVSVTPPHRTADQSVASQWTALVAWRDQKIAQARAEATAADADIVRLDDELTGIRRERVDQMKPWIDPPVRSDPDAVKMPPSPWPHGLPPEPWADSLATQIGRVSADIETAQGALDRQATLRKEQAEDTKRAGVAAETATLLGSGRFQRWLMADALKSLATRANDRLCELVDGQYSLHVDEKSFFVIDHRNADELRDSRTLSGGETFLVSLALALALADLVAELSAAGASSMESMFLDEGFGTLDAESLDAVAGALETLGASGRMIGVVTHVRELADRLSMRFEVSRGPISSTVTRVDL